MEKVDYTSNRFRMALWNVYKHKCFYCQELVDRFDNMEVDHIIPAKYKEEKYLKEFEKVKTYLGLERDFELDSYYNLVPSHRGCNRRKWDILAKKMRTLSFLEAAEENIENVKNEEIRLETNINLSKLKYYATISLRNELDPEIFDKFSKEIEDKLDQLKIEAANKRKLFERAVFQKRNQEAEEYIHSLSLDNLMIEMDVPVNNNLFAAREFFRRLKEASPFDQTTMINLLLNYCNNRPHAIFRISTLQILLQILEEGIFIQKNGGYLNIIAEINNMTFKNINYMKSNELQNVLCHLDNITTRLGKLMADKIFLNQAIIIINKIDDSRPYKEKVLYPLTIADILVNYYNFLGEMFWRDFYLSSDAQEIFDGIFLMRHLISLVLKLPDVEWPEGEEPLTFFEQYGYTFDMYCYGSYSVLKKHKGILDKLDPKILDFLNLKHNELFKIIPQLEISSKSVKKLKEKYANKNTVKIINIVEDILEKILN